MANCGSDMYGPQVHIHEVRGWGTITATYNSLILDIDCIMMFRIFEWVVKFQIVVKSYWTQYCNVQVDILSGRGQF